MVKAIFMFYNRNLIRKVLEGMQLLVEESKPSQGSKLNRIINVSNESEIRTGRSTFILKLDKEAEFICKCFLWMLAIAICFWR